MGENVVGQLEEASRILLAPPNVVSSEQRHSAENVFLDFRKSSAPYALCRHILETSKVDHVVFEAVNLLKEALIREWSLLPEVEKETLLTYLMEYSLQRTVPSFVHHKLLQVIAILVKRGSIDDFGIKRSHVLATIEAMIRNGDTPKKVLGCNIILAILQEFAITVKSSDVGLSFETHFKAKKIFEGTDLRRIFEFCVEALGEIMKTKAPYPQEITSVLGPLLSIADAILCWGFIQSNVPKRLIGVFETIYECEQPSSLRLSIHWKDIMLNPDLLGLFFTIHWNVRQNPDMLQNSLNCIMQLASLNGPVLASRDERIRYASKFMENFLELISNIEVIDQEALGISCTLRKLIAFFPPALLVGVPDELLKSMLNCISHLTCSWCGLAIKEEQNCSEEKFFIDAFDNMLEVWVSILQDTYSISGNTINDYLIQIFNKYLQARLFPPHGIRKDDDEDCSEAFVDGDNSDIKSRYKEQLQAVGLFGRQVLFHTLPLLASLIEQESSRLHEVMQKNQSNIQQDGSLSYKLHENLLWLVVIAGHVLSMDSDGEMSLIPSEIMRYSIGQNTRCEIDSTTVQLMCTQGFSAAGATHSFERCDHVVRLVSAVFRLCEVERQAAFIKELIVTMSPNLACNIMWFMKRWASCFLLPEERYYSEISTSLLAAFGRDGEGSIWCTNFLLTKVEGNLQCFNFDADVVKSTLEMLLSLVDTKEKAKTALKTEGLLKLLQFVKQNAIPFPQGCKRGLFRALVLVASSVDTEHRQSYWNEVPKPLCDRFLALGNHETIRRIFHEESVKMEIIDMIESLIGVCQGAHCTTAEALLNFLYPVMQECAFLVDLYHNYQEVVELILEFFCSCTRHMLCYLSEANSNRLNAAALETVKVYTSRNKGRFSIEAAAEENAYQDIILLLELLTGLLSKDYVVDLVPSVLQHPVQSTGGHGFDAADIVLFGLNTLMPLLSIELLKFPKLCLQYFKLITFVSELYPDKVCALPQNMLVHLMESVALGLSDLGHEVSVLSFDLVEGLASHIYGSRSQASVAGITVKKFVEFIMKMILTRQVNSDALTNAGSALYALICCYQDEYQAVVQKALNSQADEVSAGRLRHAFNRLTHNVALNMDRQEKKKFRENFEAFVADVSGFLFHK